MIPRKKIRKRSDSVIVEACAIITVLCVCVLLNILLFTPRQNINPVFLSCKPLPSCGASSPQGVIVFFHHVSLSILHRNFD